MQALRSGVGLVQQELLAGGGARPECAARARHRRVFPRRVYPLRILGMGLSGLPVGVVLWEHQAGWATWALLCLTSVAWPHLAWARSRASGDPYVTERHNLVVDSAFAGLWVSLMHFNVLPAALLLTLATVDKINTGIRGLWWRSMPWMVGGVAVGALLSGFGFQPRTSMPVILACMPILLIHTIVVSLHSYYLVRRVHGRNIHLDELSSTDPLTGLANRRQWEEDAGRMLRAWHETGAPATLVVVDVDEFKAINDTHGHAVGDDVLCAVAAILRGADPASRIGRNGGDEFALAMPAGPRAAAGVAERIRRRVEAWRLPGVDTLRCTVSIGIAPAEEGVTTLRRWMIAADAALYGAKRGGRNRIGRGAGPAPAAARGAFTAEALASWAMPPEDASMTGNDERERRDTGSTPASEGPGDRASDESSSRDAAKGPPNPPDAKTGFDREVGDINEPDESGDDGALPGRLGGGLAGG